MLDFLKKYLITGYMKFQNGSIDFGGDKLTFYFIPHLLYEYKNCWPRFGKDWGAAIFLAGRQMGEQFFTKHGVSHNKSIAEVFAMSFDILSSFGWGNFKTLKVDEKKKFMVMVGKSTLATEHKKLFGASNMPIDFMLSGLTAGALKYLTKEHVYCVELKCAAEKDVQDCVFVTGTKDNILNYILEYDKSKLSWAKDLLDAIDKLEGA